MSEEIGYLAEVKKPKPGKSQKYVAKELTFLGLKRVHMVRYELILRQDGAIWLRTI